jgi:hypothetical protein
MSRRGRTTRGETGAMVIFTTSKGKLRRWIEGSEGRMNVLRLCARGPCSIDSLSSVVLSETPRFRVSLYGMLAELNVTVDVGSFLRRELLVETGRTPALRSAAGHMRYWRTSLLAFPLSPRLALLEPEAYTAYLASWLAAPVVRERQAASVAGQSQALAVALSALQWEILAVLPRVPARGLLIVFRPTRAFGETRRRVDSAEVAEGVRRIPRCRGPGSECTETAFCPDDPAGLASRHASRRTQPGEPGAVPHGTRRGSPGRPAPPSPRATNKGESAGLGSPAQGRLPRT